MPPFCLCFVVGAVLLDNFVRSRTPLVEFAPERARALGYPRWQESVVLTVCLGRPNPHLASCLVVTLHRRRVQPGDGTLPGADLG